MIESFQDNSYYQNKVPHQTMEAIITQANALRIKPKIKKETQGKCRDRQQKPE